MSLRTPCAARVSGFAALAAQRRRVGSSRSGPRHGGVTRRSDLASVSAGLRLVRPLAAVHPRRKGGEIR
jgi:hypothetical protein